MYRTVLPFPVLPGQDAAAIANQFYERPEEYAESRRRLGISTERAYRQETPMGDFVVAYIESEKSFGETTMQMLASDLAIDSYFVDTVKQIHGVDLKAGPPPGPPPETIGAWSAPGASERGRGFAFTAPLLPDRREAAAAFIGKAFADEGMIPSRQRLNQHLEVVTLVATPEGDAVAVYLEGRDPETANQQFASSQDAFDVWFRDELAKLHPPFIDFAKPVPGVTEIFDSAKVKTPA